MEGIGHSSFLPAIRSFKYTSNFALLSVSTQAPTDQTMENKKEDWNRYKSTSLTFLYPLRKSYLQNVLALLKSQINNWKLWEMVHSVMEFNVFKYNDYKKIVG